MNSLFIEDIIHWLKFFSIKKSCLNNGRPIHTLRNLSSFHSKGQSIDEVKIHIIFSKEISIPESRLSWPFNRFYVEKYSFEANILNIFLRNLWYLLSKRKIHLPHSNCCP